MVNDAAIDLDLPQFYKEAMSSAEAKQWTEPIEREIGSLTDIKTWTALSEVPQGMKPMNTRWVFIRKRTNSRILHKARLVVKGYKQRFQQEMHNPYKRNRIIA